MNNNPYDNNPYNRNQNGNMNGNPYGNRPPRPQNMNPGGYNPNGAPRPPYPQGAPAQARTSDDGTTKTIIIVVGVIIAVAIIALVSIFAIKHINENRQNETPGYTEININFNISNYEDVFDNVESSYRDENGYIPDAKLNEVIKKDYNYIQEYNKTNNIFSDIQLNESENYISCTLPDGYTYYHYPNRASSIEDSSGNVVQTEEETGGDVTTEATEATTQEAEDSSVDLSPEFLSKLTGSHWFDQRRHDGYEFVFDENGNVTVTHDASKYGVFTQKTQYEVVSENEIKVAYTETDDDGSYTETFDIVYSDEVDVLPYTVDGEEVMDGYLHTSFESACEARQEYF